MPNRLLYRHLLVFFVYLVLIWGLHMVVVSGAAFFHFSLGHSLSIIESWIFERAWEMVIVCKSLALMFILNFVYLKSTSRTPFRDQFIQGFSWPSYELIGLILASFLLFFFFVSLNTNTEITKVYALKLVVNYLGVVVFFISDIFLMDALERMYPLRSKYAELKNFIWAGITYFAVKITYSYGENITPMISLITFFVLSLHGHKKNWFETFLYIALFLAPILVLYGQDFLWSSSVSPFETQIQEVTPVFLGIFIISIIYVGYHKHKMLQRTKP